MLAALAVLGAASPASAQALTWSVVPSPSQLFTSNLYAVSCVSAAACTAVGDARKSGGADQTLIESWNGTRWSVVPSPSPSTEGNHLAAVSCVSAAACKAVGYAFTREGEDTLVESWNGTAWSVEPSPSPGASFNDLSGVSCVSATACTAVGDSSASAGTVTQTLVESWNGTRWSVVPSPNNPGGTNDGLAGVSCVSATACTAVGAFDLGSVGQTLIESWNGSRWSVVPSPSPGASFNDLSGVSCGSAAACTAVGEISKPGGTLGRRTLIESWNGARWSVVRSPNPLRYDVLRGVSCISATACTAAGSTAKGSLKPAAKPLVESGTASG